MLYIKELTHVIASGKSGFKWCSKGWTHLYPTSCIQYNLLPLLTQ